MSIDFDKHINWEKLEKPCSCESRVRGKVPSGVRLYTEFVTKGFRHEFRRWIAEREVLVETKQNLRTAHFANQSLPIFNDVPPLPYHPHPDWSLCMAEGLHRHQRFPESPANYMHLLDYKRGAGHSFHPDNCDRYGPRLFAINVFQNEGDANVAEAELQFREPGVHEGVSGSVHMRDGDAVEIMGVDALHDWQHAVSPVSHPRFYAGWRDVPLHVKNSITLDDFLLAAFLRENRY